MPSTGSEPIYHFSFSWEGPYGRAVGLVEKHATAGLVLDLGCGYGAIGDVLVERGREYVGADYDQAAVDDLRRRGREAHAIDLSTSAELLTHQLVELVAGRQVGAVLLLDALEHLVDPLVVLGALADLWAHPDRSTRSRSSIEPPVLVTSIPNVAHIDLAAKLVGGRWDVTPSGLLDRTHLQMFTATRIQRDFASRGWYECGRNDLLLPHSDQSFPVDHPFLVEGGPARDYLGGLRAMADSHGLVNQFVRAYHLDTSHSAPSDISAAGSPGSRQPDAGQTDAGQPFLSILTRTQGDRLPMLAEALTCLAAQTASSLEVLVLVHSDRPEAVEAVRSLVATFSDDFASKVRVEQVVGGGRSSPLNRGLALARGRYVAFLDDDDLVTADWAEWFQGCVARHPGKVARSTSFTRYIRKAGVDEAGLGETGASSVTVSGPTFEFEGPFDFVMHLRRNSTPLMTYAVPRSLVTELRLGFDDDLKVCEDWEFLLRAALLVGVEDSGALTAVYQRWEGAGTTTSHVSAKEWETSHRQFLRRLDAKPLLLPPGSATAVARLVAGEAREGAVDEARRQLERDLDTQRDDFDDERRELEDRIAASDHRAHAAEQALGEVLGSEFWRITSPLRRIATRLGRGARTD